MWRESKWVAVLAAAGQAQRFPSIPSPSHGPCWSPIALASAVGAETPEASSPQPSDTARVNGESGPSTIALSASAKGGAKGGVKGEGGGECGAAVASGGSLGLSAMGRAWAWASVIPGLRGLGRGLGLGGG